MIDLLPTLRSYVLSDAEFISKLADYQGSKAIFTRMPAPQDAPYPLCLISPIVGDIQRDFISCGDRRLLMHDFFVHSTNDSSASYRAVQAAAFRLATILHNASPFLFDMPAGSQLIEVTAISPLPAPTNDTIKVSFVVSANFDILIGE